MRVLTILNAVSKTRRNVILTPPLFGGGRIHDNHTPWIYEASVSWMLRPAVKRGSA